MCKKKQFKYCPPELDKCMECSIGILNCFFNERARTMASCCGHGKYHKTIVIRDKILGTLELFSGVTIHRKKRFYKKDCEGYYYISEVEKYWRNKNF